MLVGMFNTERNVSNNFVAYNQETRQICQAHGLGWLKVWLPHIQASHNCYLTWGGFDKMTEKEEG